MIAAPVNGMEQNGLRGLVEGGVYGVLGAFGSPTATFLEALEKTSKALRDAASRMRPQTYRMRPPRIIKEGEPLAAYELSASLGELIVATVSSGEFRGEARVFSCVLPDGRCVLVTDGHVMMAHLAVGDAAELDWVIPTADIVTHDWEGLVATLTSGDAVGCQFPKRLSPFTPRGTYRNSSKRSLPVETGARSALALCLC